MFCTVILPNKSIKFNPNHRSQQNISADHALFSEQFLRLQTAAGIVDLIPDLLHLVIERLDRIRAGFQLLSISSVLSISFLYFSLCSRLAQKSIAIVRNCTSAFTYFFSSGRKTGTLRIR